MAQSRTELNDFATQQIEAIARETLWHANAYSLLLDAVQKQLRTRRIYITHLQPGWGVLCLEPRQSKRFDHLDGAIAYAFEQYEARRE